MIKRTFSPFEAIQHGFEIFYTHTGILLFILAITVIILCVLPLIMGSILNPVFTTEFITVTQKVIHNLATRDEIMSFFSQHRLFFIIAIPSYYIIFCTLMAGCIQIFFDLIDTGSSTVYRLFSLAPQAHKVTVLAFLLLILHREIVLKSILPFFTPFTTTLREISPQFLWAFYFLLFSLGLFIVYVNLRTIFLLIAFVDQKKSIVQSITHSWKITSNNVTNIIVFFIENLIIVVPLSIILFYLIDIVGLFLILPFAFTLIVLSLTCAYRKLSPIHTEPPFIH